MPSVTSRPSTRFSSTRRTRPLSSGALARRTAPRRRGQERQVHLLCLPVNPKGGKRLLREAPCQCQVLRGTIIRNLRENVLTEGNIRSLVNILDEEMDGLAHEQRERLESIEGELEDVKRRSARIWHFIETTDMEMAYAAERARELRDRREKLEQAADEARAVLTERRELLDRAETIAAFAADMSEYLRTSKLTETRAFIRSFVKEVQIAPGKATIVYTIPMPEDNPIGGSDTAGLALTNGVRSTIRGSGLQYLLS